jgi:very-short-patch-repair endonuclease
MPSMPEWFDDAVPLLAPRDDDALPRVISRADAIRRGIADHAIDRQVARRRWRSLCPGIYLTDGAPTRRDLLDAAALHGGRGAVISAAAALREYGLHSAPNRDTMPDGDGVLVLVARQSGARSCGAIRIRRTSRLPPPEPRLGPPLAAPARAVADAAREMPRLSDVRALVAEAVRLGLAGVGELSAELEAGRRNGSRLLRVAIEDVGRGARSAPEAEAAALLRAAGLAGFEQNAPLSARGRHYVADFLWRELMAVLEIDSAEHHYSPRAWRATMDRHAALETAGYSVVHQPPAALRYPGRFVDTIRAWLLARRIELASRLRA